MNQIAAAVEMYRDLAVTEAGQRMRGQTEKLAAIAASKNWELNEIAPRPKSWGVSRREYKMAMERRAAFTRIFASKIDPHGIKSAILSRSDELEVKAVREAQSDAALAFDKYVIKLTQKVGPDVASASVN